MHSRHSYHTNTVQTDNRLAKLLFKSTEHESTMDGPASENKYSLSPETAGKVTVQGGSRHPK